MKPNFFISVFLLFLLPFSAQAATAAVADQWLDLTLHPVGIISLCLFVFAYIVVISEEYTQWGRHGVCILFLLTLDGHR